MTAAAAGGLAPDALLPQPRSAGPSASGASVTVALEHESSRDGSSASSKGAGREHDVELARKGAADEGEGGLPGAADAGAPAPEPELMSNVRRWVNILGLASCWCIQISGNFIQLSTSTLAARDFSGGSATTATLPAGIMLAAAVLAATPGTLLMNRFGSPPPPDTQYTRRRPIMLIPALFAILGAALMVVAAQYQLLWLLVGSSVILGVSFAQANNLRFAALEFAPAGSETRALSAVVSGAVLSAVVGPEVARHTRNAMQPTYVATYIFLTGLYALYAVLLTMIEFHKTPALAADKAAKAAAALAASASAKGLPAPPPPPPPRPVWRLLLSPEYIVSALTGALTFAGMAGMMSGTPLAMADAGYTFSDSTQVIQVHILSMFVPSFFTGDVIRIISARWTMTLGSVMLMGGTAAFLSGAVLPAFFGANSLVGVGWNWAFVGSSAMCASAYRSTEKFVAQGCFDALGLLGTGIAVVLAGVLYRWIGWTALTYVWLTVDGVAVVLDVVLLVHMHLVQARSKKHMF